MSIHIHTITITTLQTQSQVQQTFVKVEPRNKFVLSAIHQSVVTHVYKLISDILWVQSSPLYSSDQWTQIWSIAGVTMLFHHQVMKMMWCTRFLRSLRSTSILGYRHVTSTPQVSADWINSSCRVYKITACMAGIQQIAGYQPWYI